MHVKDPTRMTDHSKTCLDQIILNIPNLFHDIRILSPISNCDHCVFGVNLLFRHRKEPVYERHIWEYDKAEFDAFEITSIGLVGTLVLHQMTLIHAVIPGPTRSRYTLHYPPTNLGTVRNY